MPPSLDITLPPGLAAIRTLPALFAWRVAQTPQAEAYRQYDDAGARWVSHTWQQASEQVARYAAALACLALPHGARVAILLPNGMAAVCVDQAALALACVPVPMHALDNPASLAYILKDSDAGLLVSTTEAQWQAIAATGVALPGLRQVVVLQKGTAVATPDGSVPVLTLDQWLASAAKGSAAPAGSAAPVAGPAADDLAALVYTSGTTGKPKGVMLSHDNVVANVKAVMQRVAPVTGDVFLSFLPLSHTFERTGGYYLPIAAGSCVAFARSIAQLSEDMLAVRPTILISVPRIYERVYGAIEAKLADARLQARLFGWAQAVGWRRFCRAQGSLPAGGIAALLDALAWLVLDPLVARTLRGRFGGRLRVAVSGGAPLSRQIGRLFLALGIPVVQGYGMTETAPVLAVNTPEDNDPETVGRALPGVELRIGENSELQARGPNVMRGYWKRDEDTAKAFIDGWLRTGDQAAIEAGRVRILGRVKEIIVTSTGEKIAPVDIELAVTGDAAFEQAYAFGDNRPFIACAVVLSRAAWKRWASDLHLDPESADSLHAAPACAAVLARLRELTSSLPYYAQPRGVILSLEPWTLENSLMTPTLKLKRNNLAAHFAARIEALYQR